MSHVKLVSMLLLPLVCVVIQSVKQFSAGFYGVCREVFQLPCNYNLEQHNPLTSNFPMPSPPFSTVLKCTYFNSFHTLLPPFFRIACTADSSVYWPSALLQIFIIIIIINIIGITVWVKKVASIKLLAIFSLLVNLCNWKLSCWLPNHIPVFENQTLSM